jgi:putative lipoic acid-binding regulatory protein
MHDRINNAQLITYEHDFSISVVTKAESRLIRELVVLIESENKGVRAGPKRIRL